MTVQETVLPPVTVPAQAGPVDGSLISLPEPAPVAAPAAPRLLGRDRSATVEERHFVIGLAAMFSLLALMITTILVLAEYVWI